jgi:hypothetical protein
MWFILLLSKHLTQKNSFKGEGGKISKLRFRLSTPRQLFALYEKKNIAFLKDFLGGHVL